MMTFNFVVVFGLARKIIHIKMLKNHKKSIFKLYIYISNDIYGLYTTMCHSILYKKIFHMRKHVWKKIYKESSSRNFLHRTMSQREK